MKRKRSNMNDVEMMDWLKTVKIENAMGCWEWPFNIERYGYGHIKYKYKMWRVHRLSYYLFNAKEPDGVSIICHKCNNRKCYNPAHLYEGNRHSNALDSMPTHKGVKLTKNVIDEILAEYNSISNFKRGVRTQLYTKYSLKYNVSKASIANVCSGFNLKRFNYKQLPNLPELEHRCSICNLTEWNNLPIPLEYRYKNNDPSDNNKENLTVVCLNCSAQCREAYDGYFGKVVTVKAKKRNREEYNNDIKLFHTALQQPYIDLVSSSDIDFSKYGWVTKVAKLLNKNPQKINNWMIRYMPDFYNQRCFKRSGV